MKKLNLLTLALLLSLMAMAQKNDSPLRIGVSGVAHGHLWNLINAMNRGDFVIVGVAEENPEFRAHNNLVGRLPKEKFYASLSEMLDKEKPEVVVDYGSILHHMTTVEACAPKGVHVMVEKPLATTYRQALRMEELARKYGIKIMVNYETTWYAANHHLKSLADRGQFGKLTRIEVYDGHQGPKEIGCDNMFLSWLTDPVE
ncbi:MAG: Gfo/Idh/MocA family oxidoreductase, partial [Bacteroidaceae bacterium]|nr:Gfo/Idh/MocA family oxidoreductase [Bacteroidaceae bacterium]